MMFKKAALLASSQLFVGKIYQINVFADNFQAELESEGLRSYKVPYHDNKKAVELLLNVS